MDNNAAQCIMVRSCNPTCYASHPLSGGLQDDQMVGKLIRIIIIKYTVPDFMLEHRSGVGVLHRFCRRAEPGQEQGKYRDAECPLKQCLMAHLRPTTKIQRWL